MKDRKILGLALAVGVSLAINPNVAEASSKTSTATRAEVQEKIDYLNAQTKVFEQLINDDNLSKEEIDNFTNKINASKTVKEIEKIGADTKLLSESKKPKPAKIGDVIVPEGYLTLKAGAYDRADLLARREKLQKALDENKNMAAAARFLIQYTPKTVYKVRAELEEQIAKSAKLQSTGQISLAELNMVLN